MLRRPLAVLGRRWLNLSRAPAGARAFFQGICRVLPDTSEMCPNTRRDFHSALYRDCIARRWPTSPTALRCFGLENGQFGRQANGCRRVQCQSESSADTCHDTRSGRTQCEAERPLLLEQLASREILWPSWKDRRYLVSRPLSLHPERRPLNW